MAQLEMEDLCAAVAERAERTAVQPTTAHVSAG